MIDKKYKTSYKKITKILRTFIKTYWIFVSLFVFGSIRRIAEFLHTVKFLGIFTSERFLSTMGPHMNFSIFGSCKSSVAVRLLKNIML